MIKKILLFLIIFIQINASESSTKIKNSNKQTNNQLTTAGKTIGIIVLFALPIIFKGAKNEFKSILNRDILHAYPESLNFILKRESWRDINMNIIGHFVGLLGPLLGGGKLLYDLFKPKDQIKKITKEESVISSNADEQEIKSARLNGRFAYTFTDLNKANSIIFSNDENDEQEIKSVKSEGCLNHNFTYSNKKNSEIFSNSVKSKDYLNPKPVTHEEKSINQDFKNSKNCSNQIAACNNNKEYSLYNNLPTEGQNFFKTNYCDANHPDNQLVKAEEWNNSDNESIKN